MAFSCAGALPTLCSLGSYSVVLCQAPPPAKTTLARLYHGEAQGKNEDRFSPACTCIECNARPPSKAEVVKARHCLECTVMGVGVVHAMLALSCKTFRVGIHGIFHIQQGTRLKFCCRGIVACSLQLGVQATVRLRSPLASSLLMNRYERLGDEVSSVSRRKSDACWLVQSWADYADWPIPLGAWDTDAYLATAYLGHGHFQVVGQGQIWDGDTSHATESIMVARLGS